MSTNVLAEIVDNKRNEVRQRQLQMPIESLKARLELSSRSLFDALSNQQSDFILECKKASPSKGLIRENFNLNDILDQYSEFASAISVLTDKKYFQGDFDYVTQASQRCSQPILCKDFFVDEYQVYEARYYGADAILLMLSVLNDNDYRALAEKAKQLNLDVLTEVHSEEELTRAIDLDAKIIGINNRDLKTLKIDLVTTETLAPKVSGERIIISESGIENRKDITRLAPLVNGFLIGSSIMAQADIRHQIKSLLYGKVKICGLTRQEDAIVVDKAGGVYGGLIFHKGSPRYINPTDALDVTNNSDLKFIGVFVNESPQTIIEISKKLNLFAIQFHGNEDIETAEIVKAALPNVELWRAVHVDQEIDFETSRLFDRYLLDTYSKESYGGTGKTFDWQLIEQNMPSEVSHQAIILAGGIDLDNVKNAAAVETFAIDLSSGVEAKPGIKNQETIKTLFNQLRA